MAGACRNNCCFVQMIQWTKDSIGPTIRRGVTGSWEGVSSSHGAGCLPGAAVHFGRTDLGEWLGVDRGSSCRIPGGLIGLPQYTASEGAIGIRHEPLAECCPERPIPTRGGLPELMDRPEGSGETIRATGRRAATEAHAPTECGGEGGRGWRSRTAWVAPDGGRSGEIGGGVAQRGDRRTVAQRRWAWDGSRWAGASAKGQARHPEMPGLRGLTIDDGSASSPNQPRLRERVTGSEGAEGG
jgi:hypothetical protein